MARTSRSAPTSSAVPPAGIDNATRETLDTVIARLGEGSRTWTALTLDQRARLLESVRETAGQAAPDWALSAGIMKGLGPTHPLRGEEWLAGPYAVIGALDAYIATLRRLAVGGSPLDGARTESRPGGRVAVRTFPRTATDSLLLSGFEGEVWLRPGTGVEQAAAVAGLGQRDPAASGGVGLVLGAGNVTSIPLLDALYELLAANRVAIVKLNPTMDSLVEVFRRAFAPLVELGLVEFVTGGGDVGGYLTAHPDVDHVHITGAEATFDAIVWGPAGDERESRRSAGDPIMPKPITAELGGVSPVIVVPGRWSTADLRFQAENIATMRLTNAGHNCIAAQVVIVSSDWPQKADFIAELRGAYAAAPARPVWYPHAADRLEGAEDEYAVAESYADGTRVFVSLENGDDATALQSTEYFAPVLGVVEVPGAGQEFLDAAVSHANDRLDGTLGANVLIDPETEHALGDGFGRAIAALRYGSIAINAWTGAAFIIPTLSWGAYPGGSREHVGSGIGVVHNSLLLADVERSVLRGPFRPFPRALRGGERTLLPKPPWFVSSRTGAAVSEGLTRYLIDRNPLGLAVTFARAFRA